MDTIIFLSTKQARFSYLSSYHKLSNIAYQRYTLLFGIMIARYVYICIESLYQPDQNFCD